MIRKYLFSAFNNALHNRLTSVINVGGLAVGLTATILITLYVVDETSYDQHWENAGQLYRVNTARNANGDGFSRWAGTAMPVLPAMRRFFPQAIAAGSRFMPLDSEVALGTRRFEERVTRVEQDFAAMFDLEIMAGSLSESLSAPDNVALRADVAARFFGVDAAAEALGEVLSIAYNGVSRDYRVAAVYRFPSGNTVLDLPMLTLLDESVLPPIYGNWGAMTVYSYVQLRPGVPVETVSAELTRFADQNVDIGPMRAGSDVLPSDRMRFDLQNIRDVHLNSAFDDSRAGGNQTVIIAFTAIAVLVLLIGAINFTILSTAQATRRGREVAMRKTIGASRGELVGQFMGESFVLVLPAMLLACVLAELMLPVFETMVGKNLQIIWFAPATLLALTAVYLAVGVLSGLYPAFVLSRFRPAVTLKSSRVADGSGFLAMRHLLVVFQFGVSIALIIATAVIYVQVRHVMERDPGFNRSNLLVIDGLIERAEVNARKETLRNRIGTLGQVSAVTLSSHQPIQTLGLANVSSPYAVPGGGDVQSITTLGIDHDFFSTYETEIVAGRDFSPALDQPAEIYSPGPGDLEPSKVMVNVSAARRLGFASPQAAVGSQIRFTNPVTNASYDLSVIGVAADTNFHSMNTLPRAEVYSLSPGFTDVLTVRFQGHPQAVQEEIADIWQALMGDSELSMSFVAQNMVGEFTQERAEAQVLISFSLLAIVIACLGLYGSTAFSVDRRKQEIGIRKVMGAQVREIVSLLLWQFSKPVLLANLIAWPAAMWSMLTWLQRFPYRIDMLLVIPLCVLAGAIALSIAWLMVGGMTARAASAKPVLVLRYE